MATRNHTINLQNTFIHILPLYRNVHQSKFANQKYSLKPTYIYQVHTNTTRHLCPTNRRECIGGCKEFQADPSCKILHWTVKQGFNLFAQNQSFDMFLQAWNQVHHLFCQNWLKCSISGRHDQEWEKELHSYDMFMMLLTTVHSYLVSLRKNGARNCPVFHQTHSYGTWGVNDMCLSPWQILTAKFTWIGDFSMPRTPDYAHTKDNMEFSYETISIKPYEKKNS